MIPSPPDPDSPVEAVLFDVDDTLCRYRRPGSELLPLAFDRVGVEPFFHVGDDHGRYPEFPAVASTSGALAAEQGRDPAVGRRVVRAYATERDHRNVRPLPGARAAGIRAVWSTTRRRARGRGVAIPVRHRVDTTYRKHGRPGVGGVRPTVSALMQRGAPVVAVGRVRPEGRGGARRVSHDHKI